MKQFRFTEKEIALCMANFDFRKAAKLYKKLNWKWHGGSTVPDEFELASHAFELLTKLRVDNNSEYYASGGLKASYEGGVPVLEFIAISSFATLK